MAEESVQTAKSFADVLNFPKRLGFLDEHTRLWLGPWGGLWDGAVFLIGLAVTGGGGCTSGSTTDMRAGSACSA